MQRVQQASACDFRAISKEGQAHVDKVDGGRIYDEEEAFGAVFDINEYLWYALFCYFYFYGYIAS